MVGENVFRWLESMYLTWLENVFRWLERMYLVWLERMYLDGWRECI